MWSLATPAALLLLPLPFLARRLLPPVVHARAALLVPPTIARRLGEAPRHGLLVRLPVLLPALVWTCLVVALAGPQRLADTGALPVSGRDIVLVLDLSGSMETEDFQIDGRTVSRLDAVKAVGSAFARGRAGDRMGLVIFAETPYFATPMTYDTEAVARAIEGATIGISGRSTAISDGLGLALKRLSASDAASRVVVLLSDGVDTSGRVAPVGASRLARELGIRVHTIALGVTATGEAGATRDSVDAETLERMAAATGGDTFRVRTTADLATVSGEIDRMEATAHQAESVSVQQPLWPWPAGLALAAGLALLAGAGLRP
ncbi:MAG: VWA domain-containing protein [Amaricoccus sp.]|uniref:VWA domain-containing protein n=1 Tax=Amaricoccus sp. TaxID=1872485 RepID=UPI0039E2C0A4